jgi:exo-beta-1,3-glucanase (GH17 family)
MNGGRSQFTSPYFYTAVAVAIEPQSHRRDQSRGHHMFRPLLPLMLWLIAGSALAAPVCSERPDNAAARAAFAQAMAQGRFVTYQPTSLQFFDGRPTQADPDSMEQDLKTLRPWFDGLITYSAVNGAGQIPDIAARLGYRSVALGIWDVRNAQEIDNAVAAVRRNPKLVRAVLLGNEPVFAGRASWGDMVIAVQKLRARLPQVAIAITEPFHLLVTPEAQPLLREIDLLTVVVHPVFQPWFRDAPTANAADFVVRVADQLAGIYCGPILVKETGEPTAPAAEGYSEARQRDFYRELERRLPPGAQRAFAYFDAFDAPWRAWDQSPGSAPGQHEVEAHWGLFTAQRQPKPVLRDLPRLAPLAGERMR